MIRLSSIKVPVLPITEIRAHSNLEVERLEVAIVSGWQLCVPKGKYSVGDRVVYFERGTAIPGDLADVLGVRNYLSEKTDKDGNRKLVVGQIKLKGESSFGLAIEVPDAFSSVQDGTDLADYFGAEKYFPPIKVTVGDADTDHPAFPKYTDIENMRSYPGVLRQGERVVATEKIHGTNVRVGFVREDRIVIKMAGSRTLRRKEPMSYAGNIYWFPWSIDSVRDLMIELSSKADVQSVVLYGEVFGSKIQAYDYGVKGALGFRAFDLMINGSYVDATSFYTWCTSFGIETAPIIYIGEFDLSSIAEISNGGSFVGGDHGREGVVVRPMNERFDPAVGRVILKYVGDDYLFGKAAKNDTTDV